MPPGRVVGCKLQKVLPASVITFLQRLISSSAFWNLSAHLKRTSQCISFQPGMEVHVFNPIIQEAECRGNLLSTVWKNQRSIKTDGLLAEVGNRRRNIRQRERGFWEELGGGESPHILKTHETEER